MRRLRGNGGDVSVNVGKRPGSETKETGAGFQNLTDGLFLVGNCGDDEVRFSGDDFHGVNSPGVSDDETRFGRDFGHGIGTILGAGNDALEFADRGEDGGRARLERDDASGVWRAWCNSRL